MRGCGSPADCQIQPLNPRSQKFSSRGSMCLRRLVTEVRPPQPLLRALRGRRLAWCLVRHACAELGGLGQLAAPCLLVCGRSASRALVPPLPAAVMGKGSRRCGPAAQGVHHIQYATKPRPHYEKTRWNPRSRAVPTRSRPCWQACCGRWPCAWCPCHSVLGVENVCQAEHRTPCAPRCGVCAAVQAVIGIPRHGTWNFFKAASVEPCYWRV